MNRKKIIEDFQNHPASKFAANVEVLQAIRSGTQGFDGDENQTEWLEKTLIMFERDIIEKNIMELEGFVSAMKDLNTGTSRVLDGENSSDKVIKMFLQAKREELKLLK